MLLTASLSTVPTSINDIILQVRTELGDPEPCPIFNVCEFCDNAVQDCADVETDFEENSALKQSITKYGSSVEYHCSLGKEFLHDDGTITPTQTLTCNWDTVWEPQDTLNQCICKKNLPSAWWRVLFSQSLNFSGVQCINPPDPDEGRNLEPIYTTGTTIEFEDTVTYVCKPGTFFEEDYHMTGFEITCLSDGTWSPLPDKRCLDPSCNSWHSFKLHDIFISMYALLPQCITAQILLIQTVMEDYMIGKLMTSLT